MADYVPNTAREQEEMLTAIGMRSMEDLFSDIPASIRLQEPIDLPQPLSEMELSAYMQKLSEQNVNLDQSICFLGAGAYDHYVPAAVKNLIARQEFYTAYTPYQPEISQGTLQSIFEFQSLICELTGMDAANASMYDGATALAEAALLAAHKTRRHALLVAQSIHPDSRAVLETYAHFNDLCIRTLPFDETAGTISFDALSEALSDEVAAVLVQDPNFFGMIEPLPEIAELVHRHGALFIVSSDPIALGILEPPGSSGADIVTGEGQALGNGLYFGGPSLGFFAVRKDLMRRMPGRMVGETTDARGRRCYVLTLQAREQHIRREKATSNICTNQALNALAATIYLSLNGPHGLARIAELCVRKSWQLREALLSLPGFSPLFEGPFFREFAVRYAGDPSALNRFLLKEGLIGGLDLSLAMPSLQGCWLLAVTEKRTDEDIDRFVDAVRRCVTERGGKEP